MITKEAAELWGITPLRIQVLSYKGQVKGTTMMGKTWIIPRGTPKPPYGRTKALKEHR